MEDAKATAWLTLADADAVEQKVLTAMAKAFFGYNVDNMENQKQLGYALLNNFAVQNHLKAQLLDMMQHVVKDEICNKLNLESYYDRIQQLVHLRVTYQGNPVATQAINLRGY
jgi:hypothetical protein